MQAPKAEAYRLLELPVPWQGKPGWASVESGQLLFNRFRFVAALLLHSGLLTYSYEALPSPLAAYSLTQHSHGN